MYDERRCSTVTDGLSTSRMRSASINVASTDDTRPKEREMLLVPDFTTPYVTPFLLLVNADVTPIATSKARDGPTTGIA